MKSFGEYEFDNTFSTLLSRDAKDAKDLVIHGTQDPCVSDTAFTLGRNQGQENALFIQNSRDEIRFQNGDGQISGTLAAKAGAKQRDYVLSQNKNKSQEITGTLTASYGGGGPDYDLKPLVFRPTLVRKLTPIECERLQGFPDNWTRINWKGKEEKDCPDGHRYKAMGNSMAIPVVKWIGERINNFENGVTTEDSRGSDLG